MKLKQSVTKITGNKSSKKPKKIDLFHHQNKTFDPFKLHIKIKYTKKRGERERGRTWLLD